MRSRLTECPWGPPKGTPHSEPGGRPGPADAQPSVPHVPPSRRGGVLRRRGRRKPAPGWEVPGQRLRLAGAGLSLSCFSHGNISSPAPGDRGHQRTVNDAPKSWQEARCLPNRCGEMGLGERARGRDQGSCSQTQVNVPVTARLPVTEGSEMEPEQAGQTFRLRFKMGHLVRLDLSV